MSSKSSYISIGFFILIGVLPFFAALLYALGYSLGLFGILNDGFTTTFWENIFRSGEFLKSFGYSAIVAALAVILSVGGALWVVLSFKEKLNSSFLSFMLYLPLAIPGVVTGFFVLQLFAKAGFFSRIAYQLGFINRPAQFPDLVNDSLAIGIITAFISLVLPFFILLFINVYKNERLEELSVLAKSLGAKKSQVTRRVVLPILLKRTKTLIALYFIFLLGAYEVPLLLGQESPQMLSVLIIRETRQFDLTKISEGYAIAVVYSVIVALVAILLFLPKRKKAVYEN